MIDNIVTAGLYIGKQRSQTQGRDPRSQRIEDVEAAGAFVMGQACEGSMVKKDWILTLRWLTHSLPCIVVIFICIPVLAP